MIQITHYSVDYRHPGTGYWKRWDIFKSPFQYREIVQHKWLWFKRTTPRTEITNQKEAEDEVRAMAVQSARELSRDQIDVRVCKQEMFVVGGKRCYRWILVWENSKFKDC